LLLSDTLPGLLAENKKGTEPKPSPLFV